MRHFYIFNINNDFISISKTHPYSLYKTFNDLYNNKEDYKLLKNLYGNIINPIKKNKINYDLYNKYKIDEYYTKFMNNHYYNNYLNKEETKLSIYKSYLKIDTNNNSPTFFKSLNKYNNLFVCDFDNNDYFYLENIA